MHRPCKPTDAARVFIAIVQMANFLENFGDDGFFAIVIEKWEKWMARHQHLPLSMARLGCPSFFVGSWDCCDKSYEYAVGQEFASAFGSVLWPEEFTEPSRTSYESQLRKVLKEDLVNANTRRKKDELTLGLFSVFNDSKELRNELKMYGSSGKGRVERGKHAVKGVSSFRPLPEFPLIYQQVCVRIYIGAIQQQLIESYFSKYDTSSRLSDPSEMDGVRTGQYKSLGSANISSLGAQPKQIREAGKAAIQRAQSARKVEHAKVPLPRSQRKRPIDGRAALKSMENLKKPRHTPVGRRSSGGSSSAK